MNNIFRLRKINKNQEFFASNYLGFSINKLDTVLRVNFIKKYSKLVN